jgi:hypothetical protein
MTSEGISGRTDPGDVQAAGSWALTCHLVTNCLDAHAVAGRLAQSPRSLSRESFGAGSSPARPDAYPSGDASDKPAQRMGNCDRVEHFIGSHQHRRRPRIPPVVRRKRHRSPIDHVRQRLSPRHPRPEGQFHDELEQRLRNDPTLGGRLTRRDRVGGGFDDLLHDSVIAELKVERNKAITVRDGAKFLGQPVQYGIGCGSQLSILVVLDHSKNKPRPESSKTMWDGCNRPRTPGPIPDIRRWSAC